ncbi:hypothetical protein ABZ599_32705 [Streptomyces misionensis]|uniref:hypothetical protein n=1 Tax=Streptomyces misionensis TaxID=67331 RepID=UPI0033E6C494
MILTPPDVPDLPAVLDLDGLAPADEDALTLLQDSHAPPAGAGSDDWAARPRVDDGQWGILCRRPRGQVLAKLPEPGPAESPLRPLEVPRPQWLEPAVALDQVQRHRGVQQRVRHACGPGSSR